MINPMPAAFVTEQVVRTKPIIADDFRFIKALTDGRPKVTMPTPSIFHIGLFDDSVDRAVYPDIKLFFDDMVTAYRQEIADLGSAGCGFLQFDEPQLAILCDPDNRTIAQKAGHDADSLIDFYIDINNRIVASKPAGMTIGMHLCRGNQSGLFMASGGYDPVAERLFNNLDVDVYYLEYDNARAGDFSPLRFVPTGKIVVLGIVSTKSGRMETLDELKRRIDQAAKFVPLDQIAISPQCGFASSISNWNVTKNPMTLDLQRRKLALIVETAREIWH